MEQQNSSKRIKQMADDLSSGEESRILDGLENTSKYGNASIIPLLIDLLADSPSKLVYDRVCHILFQLKNKDSLQPILQAIKSPKTKNHRHILVSAIWQSGLDASDSFLEIVNAAIESNYLCCLECISVIENLATPPKEDQVAKAIDAIQKKLAKSGDKKDLLISLATTLREDLIGG